jgi:hypothetical protein
MVIKQALQNNAGRFPSTMWQTNDARPSHSDNIGMIDQSALESDTHCPKTRHGCTRDITAHIRFVNQVCRRLHWAAFERVGWRSGTGLDCPAATTWYVPVVGNHLRQTQSFLEPTKIYLLPSKYHINMLTCTSNTSSCMKALTMASPLSTGL